MKRIPVILAAIAILVSAGWLVYRYQTNPTRSADSSNGTASLNLAIFPRRIPQVSRKSFQPLADYLQSALNRPIHLITPATYKEFWQGVKSGTYDIVHFNQYHYIESHKKFGYQAIVANEEGGSRTISGAIFVKAARRDLKSLPDLRGKTIVFGGGKKAMVSYITTTALLKKAGLNSQDYTVIFAKNPPFAIVDAFMNKGEAAAAGAHLLNAKSVKKRIGQEGIDKMRILAVGDPITHLPWAVNSSMPARLRKKIRNSMIFLKAADNGKSILKAARVSDFYAVTDRDYDKSRELVKYVTGETY
ncbi:MAG TPA: phosphate/phosphite/phosphonate ABC transporter substrate-binding protein [Thiolapillus brandeum]|uniref:Phosphate/phosphite/phosphonate ABC transporter substrate-binding protein n=1 Tax=Thiolapillus brandeum TaxID=1076588 RepID=A0A831WF82_9GAMM|nr:phosphate/phosphite/phosphonate ABC transporter substrate-binding protein [Thiolapillus brandeum]